MNRQNVHRPESLILSSSNSKSNLNYDVLVNSNASTNSDSNGNSIPLNNKRTPTASATPSSSSSSKLSSSVGSNRSNSGADQDNTFDEQDEIFDGNTTDSNNNNNTLNVPQLLSATSAAFPGSNGNINKSPISPSYQDKVKNSRRFYTWSKFEVHTWVSNISDLVRINKNTEISRFFIENNITGDLLPFLTMSHFSDMNILELKPKLILKKHINLLLESHMDLFGSDENDEYVESLSNSPLMDENLRMMERYLMNVSDKILSNINFNGNGNSSDNNSFSSRGINNNNNIHNNRHHHANANNNLNNSSSTTTPRVNKRFPDIDPKNASSPLDNAAGFSLDGPSLATNSNNNNDTFNESMISGTPDHSNFISDYEDDADNTYFDDTMDSTTFINNNTSIIDDHEIKHKESLELLNGNNSTSATNSANRFLHDIHSSSLVDSKKPPFEMKYDSLVESSPLNSPLPAPLSKKPSSSSTITTSSIPNNNNKVKPKPTLTVATPSAYQAAQSSLQTPHSATYPTPPILSHKPSSNFQNSSSSLPKSEPLKQLKAKYDDPCYKVLQKAMIKHKINNVDWRNYVLVICYGDKERILRPEEKPVKVFKELQDRGQHPSFMIRQLEGASPSQDSFDYSATESTR